MCHNVTLNDFGTCWVIWYSFFNNWNKKFWDTFITSDTQQEDIKFASSGKFFSVVAVTITNGGDYTGMYSPLFTAMISVR